MTFSATSGPISGNASSLSRFKKSFESIYSSYNTILHKVFAVFFPTPGIHKAFKTVTMSVFLTFSMPSKSLSTDFSLNQSSCNISDLKFLSLKISQNVFIYHKE
jgi:hypothetical protein